MIYRLTYLSEAELPFDGDALTQVLTSARRNNAAAEVTGLLVFHDGRFLQVLEGPRANVLEIFEKIGRDPRHHTLRLLDAGDHPGRAFGQWRMGYAHPDTLTHEARTAAFSIYRMIPFLSPERGQCPDVRHHVKQFLAGFSSLHKSGGTKGLARP